MINTNRNTKRNWILINLQRLRLYNNQLTEIPKEICSLINLTNIRFR